MKDFEDTRDLSTDALHALLVEGDARERVLAIWALALRLPTAMTMVDQLRGEPDPGVRRALAVVLAGNGELDLLVALCRHDPSVHVRASAVQMVVRFAVADRVPWSIVSGRLTDAPEVRAAVLSQLDASAPVEVRAAAVACLRDDDEMVRREAFETCAKLVKAGLLGTEVLCHALDRAREGECANALALWLTIETADVIGPVLATASRQVREVALRRLPHLRAAMVGDDVELYERLGPWDRPPLHEMSLALVLDVGIRNPRWLELVEHVVTRLAGLAHLPAEIHSKLATFAASCEELVATVVDDDEAGELALCDDDDDDDHVWVDPSARLRLDAALRDQVARLLG